ncbi:MAG TPA: hypothetical protein VG073_02755 [Gaiellaceae bacterium]|nr:hypothetical protein [Gaiellaceae bacterium]
MYGPLVVNWRSCAVEPVHAGELGRARAELENAGSAAWRPGRVRLSYHWLDDHGNPILWDGLRTELERRVEPGESVQAALRLRGPIPPGRYALAFDLVEEGRFWFAEVGNETPTLAVEVEPRRAEEAVAHLDGVEPSAGWHGLVRAAHERGYAAVAGSIDRGRRGPRELEPYAPGGGRDPAFGSPLVCPSLLPPLEPNAEVAGLPAWLPEGDEPWLYDGRITARLRAGRPRS